MGTIIGSEEKRAYILSLKKLVTEIIVMGLILTAVFTLVFGITVQHGADMYPAIRDGDIVLYYRIGKVMNTDAVVYKAGEETYIGRVAACEGTEIDITSDMQLTIDGIYMPISPDSGIYSRTYAAEGEKYPVTVRTDHYYILGDNRDVAEDSRMFGQVSKRNIKGRIVTILRRRQI